MAGRSREYREVVCQACSLACDDLVITVAETGGFSLTPGCGWAEAAYQAAAAGVTPSPPADADFARAASWLAHAVAPVIIGLQGLPVEAQRAGLLLAERRRARVVPIAAGLAGLASRVLTQTGGVHATFGEIRDRADLVVLWGCPADQLPPRLVERFRLAANRRVIQVGATPLPQLGEVIPVAAAAHTPAWATLRAMQAGKSLDESRVLRATGVPLATWAALQQQLAAARYAAVVLGPEIWTAPTAEAALTDAAEWSIRAQDPHRAALLLLDPDDIAPAGPTATWLTGVGGGLDFGTGSARPLADGMDAASLLATGAWDLALVAPGVDAHRPHHAEGWRRLLPILASAGDQRRVIQVVCGSEPVSWLPADGHRVVSLPTASPLWSGQGSVFRADGVALPIRPLAPSPLPRPADVLAALAERLSARQGTSEPFPQRQPPTT